MELDLRDRGRDLTIDGVHEAIQRFYVRALGEPTSLVISADQEASLLAEWDRALSDAPEKLGGEKLFGVLVKIGDDLVQSGPAVPGVPDLIQPVIGFRSFGVRSNRLVSSGGAIRYDWAPGPNRARCLRNQVDPLRYPNAWAPSPPPAAHDAPHPDCACGLYAMHSAGDVGGNPATAVCGAICAWGRIEVHATGLRAEYARVVALAPLFPPEWGGHDLTSLGLVAWRYGVPLLAFGELESAAREHGIAVPAELRPEPQPEPEPRVTVAFAAFSAGLSRPFHRKP